MTLTTNSVNATLRHLLELLARSKLVARTSLFIEMGGILMNGLEGYSLNKGLWKTDQDLSIPTFNIGSFFGLKYSDLMHFKTD